MSTKKKSPSKAKKVQPKLVSGCLYLELFHGRDSLDQDMEDWGDEGPNIGPLKFCHTTYGTEMALQFVSVEAHDHFFEREVASTDGEGRVEYTKEAFLKVVEDCILYQGKYYGDWSAFIQE